VKIRSATNTFTEGRKLISKVLSIFPRHLGIFINGRPPFKCLRVTIRLQKICAKISFLWKRLNFFAIFSTFFFKFGKHQYGLIQRGRLMYAICYLCGTCTLTSVKHTQLQRAVLFVTPILTSICIFLPLYSIINRPQFTFHYSSAPPGVHILLLNSPGWHICKHPVLKGSNLMDVTGR